MTLSKLSATLVATTLLSTAAFAQSTMQTAPSSTAATTQHATDMASANSPWRASKLNGVNVYNNANEKIGEIDELLLNHRGQIDSVVVEVGGFLGMGKHHVALKFDDVKFTDQAPNTAATSATRTTTTGTTTTETRPVTNASANTDKMYPDRAVVNMTKDQLKALPEVKYAR